LDPRTSSECEELAFQGAWLGRRLFRSVFGFGWQVCRQPIHDAAFQSHGAETLPNQQCSDVRAGQLVRVRIVDDDAAISREGGRGAVAQKPDGARQADRAVFVRILQTRVDEHRRRIAVELQFEIFFGDARDSHGFVFSSASRRAVNPERMAGRRAR